MWRAAVVCALLSLFFGCTRSDTEVSIASDVEQGEVRVDDSLTAPDVAEPAGSDVRADGDDEPAQDAGAEPSDVVVVDVAEEREDAGGLDVGRDLSDSTGEAGACEGAANPGAYLCVVAPSEASSDGEIVDPGDADVTFVGVVTGDGEGEAPGGCGEAAPPQGARWFRVEEDDGSRWMIQWRLGTVQPYVEPGSRVSGHWVSRREADAPDEVSLLVTTEAGALIGWYAESGSAEALAPPPIAAADLALGEGEVECRGTDDCNQPVRRGLVWDVGGYPVVVPYGATKSLGSVRLVGGVDRSADGCPDADASRAVAAAAAVWSPVEFPDSELALACQAAADRLTALHEEAREPPQNLIPGAGMVPVLRGNEFDAERTFEALDRLRMEDGWVLDYVYEYDLSMGFPRLYARRADTPRLADIDAYRDLYEQVYSPDPPADLLENVDIYPYYHIVPDGTPEGWCQLATFRVQASHFYQYRHALLEDMRTVYARSAMDQILDAETICYAPFSEEQRAAALLSDLNPQIRVRDGVVYVEHVRFTKWGGFQLNGLPFPEEFPHGSSGLRASVFHTLVDFDCGVTY